MKQAILVSVATCATFFLCVVADETRAQEPQRHSELKRLRVLLVLDTHGPDIKDVVNRDWSHLDRFLKAGIPADRYTVDQLKDDDVSAEAILNYYANLKASPDEALLFYYVGHGGMDESDQYLTMKGDGRAPVNVYGVQGYVLGRKTIVSCMKAKQPGLVVVLTACCSSYLPGGSGRRVPTFGEARPAAATATEIKPVIRSLFFEHRGIVDITAAPPGESAIGDNQMGTYFTSKFVELALRDDLKSFQETNDFVTWKGFHKKLREEMNTAAMTEKRTQEADWKAGRRTKKVEAALDYQLAYGYQLADEGKIPRSKWLFGAAYNERDGKGLDVLVVYPDTPAGKAGFHKGDILLSINGDPLELNYDFHRALQKSEGRVKVEYVDSRIGRTKTIDVTLEKAD